MPQNQDNPSDTISSTNGNNEIYYQGTPTFKPRTITPTVTAGTYGAPPPAPVPAGTTTSPSTVNVTDQVTQLQTLQDKFTQLGNLLDQKGQTMTLCQNLPPAISARYLQELQPGESCWNLYKRMASQVSQLPTVDTNNFNTYATSLATQGNTVITNPFPIDTSGNTSITTPSAITNYNQNPGGPTLAYMVFVAIIMPIASLMLNVLYPLGLAVVNVIGAVLGPIGAAGLDVAYSIAFDIVKGAFLSLVQQIIGAGPTLQENVSNYNSLIITQHAMSSAQYSSDLNWPEAVMLFPQYLAMQQQYQSNQQAYNYFSSNATANTRQGSNTTVTNGAQMPSDLATVMQTHQDYIGQALDRMTSVMVNTGSTDLLCCLIRLLGSQDLRWLNTAKAILQLTLNRQAQVYESLDSVLSNIWHAIEKVILSTILSILYNLFDEINSRIKSDLNNFTMSPFYQSNQCLTWNLFVQNMLQSISGIEQSILDLVTDLNHSLQAQDQYNQMQTAALNTGISNRFLLNLLNLITEAQELGTICASSNIPTDAELQTLYNQVLTQFQLPTNIGTASGTNTSTQEATITTSMNQFDECLSKVPAEQVAEVMAWIQNLTNNG